jgi:hypothetical protein
LQQIGQHELAGILNKSQGKISEVAKIQWSSPLTYVHKNGRSFEHSTDPPSWLCHCTIVIAMETRSRLPLANALQSFHSSNYKPSVSADLRS